MIITIAGIDDFVSTNSLGIQAISDGLLCRLRDIFPDARFIKHLKDYSISKSLWKEADNVEGCPHLYDEYFARFLDDFKDNHPERVNDIKQSDQLIICGDGIIADIFPQWCLLLAAEAAVARENHVSFVTLDQSVNVSRNSFAGYAVKNIFLKAPMSVRELDSLRILREEFNKKSVNLSIDTAFLVNPLSPSETSLYDQYLDELKRKYRFDDYLVFSVRGKRPFFQIIDPNAWAKVLEKLSMTFETPILFASSCPAEDFPLARDIQSRFDNFIIADEFLDYRKYNYRVLIHFLERAVANISDRYHQNVFSLLSNTPFIPVEGNTSKSRGLIEMIKYPFDILPVLTTDHLALYDEKIEELFSRYHDIKHFLKKDKQINTFDNYRSFLT